MAYIGKQPIVGNYQVLDALTATTTDTYALTKNSVAVYPQTPANCIVSLNGVIQAPYDSYTISGSNIVFASALTASDSIDFITVLGDVLNVGTVSDGTITTAKIADGNVTTAKLANTSVTPAKMDLSQNYTFTGAVSGHNYPAWSVYLSSNQSVPSTTATKINFDSITFDSDNVYDNSTDYEVTIPTGKGGKYWIYILLWIDNIDGIDEVATARLYKNGSLLSNPQFFSGMNGSGTTGDGGKVYINVSGLVTAADGDTFSVYCYHNSGATENARGNNCSFHGYRIGD